MFTSKMSSGSSEEHEINEFFKSNSKWSLLSFLQYRQVRNDFSHDKLREHRLYKSSLEKLPNDYARNCLNTFEVKYM